MDKIRISKHTLENFTGFKGKHEVDFHSTKPTLILGINGSGKTSLLSSLYGNIIQSLKDLHLTTLADINVSKATIHFNQPYSLSTSNFVLIENEAKSFEKATFKTNVSGTKEYDFSGVKSLDNIFRTKLKENKTLSIFRFFQSDKIVRKSNGKSNEHNKIENRVQGYVNHASPYISLDRVTSFYIDQINNENQQKIEKKDFKYETSKGKYIRETLNCFANILYGNDLEIAVKPSKFSTGQSIVVMKENQELEFLQLSSGEKYVIAMVLELIYRNITLNPNQGDLKNTPGIVLIDEIEDHLHPRWQLTILKALKESFPNIQFIVASHSPLIASSVRSDQIIALSNFEVIPSDELPNIYSGTADELLHKILFSDYQINDFNEQRISLDKLIRSFKFDEAEKLLETLKRKVNSSPKWIKDYERKISFGKA